MLKKRVCAESLSVAIINSQNLVNGLIQAKIKSWGREKELELNSKWCCLFDNRISDPDWESVAWKTGKEPRAQEPRDEKISVTILMCLTHPLT